MNFDDHEYGQRGNPADLQSYSTRQLLALRYNSEYDLYDVLAVLNTREHVMNKEDRKNFLRLKHGNGPDAEKKKMRFYRDGRQVPRTKKAKSKTGWFSLFEAKTKTVTPDDVWNKYVDTMIRGRIL